MLIAYYDSTHRGIFFLLLNEALTFDIWHALSQFTICH